MTLGIHPFRTASPSVFIIISTIQMYDEEMYEKGMKVVTAATTRNHPNAMSPRIKSLNYLNNILAKLEAIDAGCLEAVMLNHHGYVAECTGDNVFVVNDDGVNGVTLTTPPLHAGILEGAVSTEADLHKARLFRERCGFLISLGDCAVAGNVPSMRNTFDLQDVYDRAFVETARVQPGRPTVGVPPLLDTVRPVHHVVDVDLFVQGCPPSADEIRTFLWDLLDGKEQPEQR